MLLGGVPGVPPAEVVVLGGGVSGTHAATIALGMGARCHGGRPLGRGAAPPGGQFGPALRTIFSTRDALSRIVRRADLVIGAVLVPGAAAPKLVTRDMVATMKPGSRDRRHRHRPGRLLRDLAGRPRHSHPTYVVDGVIALLRRQHAGRGGAHLDLRAQQRHLALRAGAGDKGWRKALSDDPHLREGLNVCAGKLTCQPVAAAHGLPYRPAETLLSEARLAQAS